MIKTMRFAKFNCLTVVIWAEHEGPFDMQGVLTGLNITVTLHLAEIQCKGGKNCYIDFLVPFRLYIG